MPIRASHLFGSAFFLLMASAASAHAQASPPPASDPPVPPPVSAVSAEATAATIPPVTAAAPDTGVSIPERDLPIAPDAPSSGYRNGTFFIRSPDDVFRLYIQGRVHADWTDQFGPGTSKLPPGAGVNNGFFLRRARLELAGEFYETWQWQVGAEFSSATSIDNYGATQATPSCSVSATGAQTCANAENPVDNPTVKPIPTDVFVNYAPSPYANVEVGQFYLPFTLENRISDNTTPFLERSLPVRTIGAPLQREDGAMFWGESPDRVVYYAASIVNGDGPNRTNVDARYDFVGRVVVRPFANTTTSPTKWAQIGISGHQGSRDPAKVGYDLPALTTQDGFAFWKPTYKDSLGRTTHIMPSASQWAVAGDVYLPIENFDLTGEFIYASDDTREAIDGYQISPYTERTGTFKGYGWYAEASYWILGSHDIIGYPSYGRPIHVDLKQPQRPAQQGLQVLAKFEQLHMTYRANARGGVPDARTPDGDIEAETVEFGLSYWATRHLRVGFNYAVYLFPDSAPVSPTTTGGPQQTSDQRAVAPGQQLAKGLDDTARNSSHTLNELSVRVGVQF